MATAILMTAAEFEDAGESLGPCELVRGEVIPLSPGGVSHSRISLRLGFILERWAQQSGLGRVFGNELGIVVERNPDTVRGADVAYISYKRLPKGTGPQGFSAVAPDLVAEVIGRGHGWRDMLEKAGEYLRMGTDCVWIIDPKTQRLHIYRADTEPAVLNFDDVLVDEVILPGFSCTVAELFED